MMPDTFHIHILDWFDHHGRKNLPWQINRTPYRVWVSEIMLQQTQVATVIPYFQKFMREFPDVLSLADAPLDKVIAHWAGLGYYARARNLHRTAINLREHHGGEFPADPHALESLPGIGRSTAGAILSLGLNIPAPILDGNVKRVLCRYAGLSGWPGNPSVSRSLWRLSEALTPTRRAADYNQAMMDLGALVCLKRRPDCNVCPLFEGCVARQLNQIDVIPAAKPRRENPVKCCYMLVLNDPEDRIWLDSRPPSGIWGGLKSLPEFTSLASITDWCISQNLGEPTLQVLPLRRHTFSHFHLDYIPVRVRVTRCDGLAETANSGWYSLAQAGGLPAPVDRLLRELAHPLTG